ncbi:MAG: glycerol acyltransferase [Phycisphaerae bacterium]|nr:glycerol acyltransferase [Phycisphaerae bacterium]
MLFKPPQFKTLDIPSSKVAPTLTRRFLMRLGTWLSKLHVIDDVLTRIDPELDRCPHQQALDHLGVDWNIEPSELEQIPEEGPVLVVSNHAFGGADGLVLATAIQERRPDFHLLTNFMLLALAKLRHSYLPLNPFSKDASTNVHTLKKAIKKLKAGEVIATFPAGEVSHRTWSNWSVNDPPWSTSIATMALRSNATVVPIYFHGRNSNLFQLAGLIHPFCRTMLLGRELTNKRGHCIRASIGKPITAEKLQEFPDRETLTEYLRGRVYILADRKTAEPESQKQKKPTQSLKRLLPEITVADRCADEIMALNERQQLVQSGNLTVYIAKSRQIPNILQEMGRLRELTFRAVGEGTGNEIDLDEFDQYYRHLFVWNHETQEIVGAYRLGLTDEIMRTRGVRGLYTWTLFNFDKRLFETLGPAVELGRSFIRPEYQRNFKPLMLLWRGISRFICLKPKYRYFFGVVSISNEYSAASKRLMTDFVSSTCMVNDFQSLISARNPHQPKRARHFDLEPLKMVCTQLEDVEELVRDIENGRQGVPILLKQYLKLNAKLVTVFNVDKEFSDVIDGLMLVDFLDVERRILDWYFGKEEASRFLQYYGRDDDYTPPPEQPPDSSAGLGATG